MPGLAAARGPVEQYTRFQMSVERPNGFVFDIQATRKDPYDTVPPLISRASMKFSPRLCEGAYRLAFVFSPVRGDIVKFPYAVRVRRAQLDGAPRRCPFAGLPPRGLKSIGVRISLNVNALMSFSARPATPAGKTFDRLEVPALRMYRFTAPGGLVRVQISARYSKGGPRKIDFVADTKAPR
jgi:hypothetical protein